jgi:hypothetical protein
MFDGRAWYGFKKFFCGLQNEILYLPIKQILKGYNLSWSFGSLNLRISTLPLLGVLGKCHFDVGHMKSCKIYYGESGASRKSPSHDESNLKVVQNLDYLHSFT